MSEKILHLKEKGILRALKEKWIGSTSEHKRQCEITSNDNGDHILITNHFLP